MDELYGATNRIRKFVLITIFYAIKTSFEKPESQNVNLKDNQLKGNVNKTIIIKLGIKKRINQQRIID